MLEKTVYTPCCDDAIVAKKTTFGTIKNSTGPRGQSYRYTCTKCGKYQEFRVVFKPNDALVIANNKDKESDYIKSVVHDDWEGRICRGIRDTPG